MGIAVVKVRVKKSHEGRRSRVVEFLVDSSAVYSVVGSTTLRGLGIRPHRTCDFFLADGSKVTRVIGDAYFEYKGIGGAAPVIVNDDADVDQALAAIPKGGFYHAGQVCVSVQRVFAHKSIARRMAERLAEQASRLKVGDPTDEATEVGPLIRHGEVRRVHEWVEEARTAGAEVLTGGAPISESCYPPTVLYDPPDSVRLSTAEVFGPVVCIYPFADLDESIDRANSLPYAFQAAVFARDLDVAMHAYARLDASVVMINDHTAFRVDWMPFAGLRESGLGVGGIPHSMKDMQIEKLVVIRSKGI